MLYIGYIFQNEYKDCEFHLEYEAIEDTTLTCNCPGCNKNYEKGFDEELKKRFACT